MATFTKLGDGNVIYEDGNGQKTGLLPNLNVLPHPISDSLVILNATPVKDIVGGSFIVDWNDITSPVVTSRNTLIEELITNFFFSVTGNPFDQDLNISDSPVFAGLSVGADTDTAVLLGRARISSPVTDVMYLMHHDRSSSADFAVCQDTNGLTTLSSRAGSGRPLNFAIGGAAKARVNNDGSFSILVVKTGATQAAAGAGEGELWATSSHATLPDNVVLIGV